MGKNVQFVSHKKSKLKVDGKPQLPSSESLIEGEIAINFAKDVETLSIKNESGDVVTFSSDNYYTEQKLGSGFTGENSAKTVTEVIENLDLGSEVEVNSGDTPSGQTVEIWIDESIDPELADVYTKQEVDERIYWTSGSGVSSVVMKGTSGTASGDYSIAEGMMVTASGGASHAEGGGTIANGNASHAEGNFTIASGSVSHAEGSQTIAGGDSSHAEGISTQALGEASHAEGELTIAINDFELAAGMLNKSVSGSSEFGDSGNTLFSIGNGTTENTRHNAFEVRQNGDIYIVNKDGDTVRLQDEIGNAGIDVDQVIDSGTSASTNAVSTSAVFNLIKDDEYIIAQALNDLNENKLDITAYTPVDLSDYYTTAQTYSKQEIDTDGEVIATALADLDERKLDASAYTPVDLSNYYTKAETNSAITESVSGKQDTLIVGNGISITNDEISVDADQLIDGTTSASTKPVTTSAVYGFVTAYTPSITVDETIDSTTSGSSNPVATKAVYSALTSTTADFFDDAKYEMSGTTHVINFYHDNTIKATIDATDFVKDGMIDSVTVETSGDTSVLVITWNTDAGKSQTILDIGDIFEADNYYTTAQTDNAIAEAVSGKLDTSIFDTYSAATDASIIALSGDVSANTVNIAELSGTVSSHTESINDLSGQSETIATALVELNTKKADKVDVETINKTYSELKALRDNGSLVKGAFYRITDFVTTVGTAQTEVRSAGHAFDIIVQALDTDVLCEDAHAIQHSGDTYFANSKLEAWQLKYSIDNDTTRFEWADATNGKGVIYYMKDEFRNEVGCDFKNVQYKLYKVADSHPTRTSLNNKYVGLKGKLPNDAYYDIVNSVWTQMPATLTIPDETDYIWAYTFSSDSSGGTQTDNSLDSTNVIKNNIFLQSGSNIESLPFAILFGKNNYDNFFNSCFACCIFASSDSSANFGGKFVNRIVIGRSAGNDFYGNDITAGNVCLYNVFRCTESCFGDTIGGNIFSEQSNKNCFGNTIVSNLFLGKFSRNNIASYVRECFFEPQISYVKVAKEYIQQMRVGRNNKGLLITSNQTTSSSNIIKTLNIGSSINNSELNIKTISHNSVNDDFETTYQNANNQIINV